MKITKIIIATLIVSALTQNGWLTAATKNQEDAEVLIGIIKSNAESDEKIELLKKELAHGRDVNATDGDGKTALHANRDLDILLFLVNQGADITPLLFEEAESIDTLDYNNPAIAIKNFEIFMQLGADVNAKDKNGKTVIDIVHNPEIKSYFIFVRDFHQAVKKPETFDTFASTHLLDRDGSQNEDNIYRLKNLFHLSNRPFIDKFITFAEKTNKEFKDRGPDTKKIEIGNEILDIAFSCPIAEKESYWLNQFFALLAASTEKVKKGLSKHFTEKVDRISQEKRDEILEKAKQKLTDITIYYKPNKAIAQEAIAQEAIAQEARA